MAQAPLSPAADQEESVVEAARTFILCNPEFVLGDAELMRALLSASEDSTRQITDLRSVHIERMEKRLGMLREAHRDVVDAVWDSVAGVEQAQHAALALLDAKTFGQFLETLVSDLPELLHVEIARLCFEGAETRRAVVSRSAAAAKAGRELAVIEAGGVEGRLPARATGATVRFRNEGPAEPELFGDEAKRLKSEALIALDLGDAAGPGLLALGSTDPERFHERQEADPLMFLGGVVERLLRDWLEGRRKSA